MNFKILKNARNSCSIHVWEIQKRQIYDRKYVFWSCILLEICLFSIAQNITSIFAKTLNAYTEDVYIFPK
jgi:hypothetical protein